VAPARVSFESSTELTIEIDEANTDGWTAGWNDIGVADYGDETPDDYLELAFRYEEGLMATIDSVKPGFGALVGTLTIIGTGFADDPSLTKMYKRESGDADWEAVTAANISYESATELTLTLAEDESWDGGWNDLGVSVSSESTPDDSLERAFQFYTAGADDPNAIVVGPVEEVYIDGRYAGDLADEVGWDVREEIVKIFTQHSRTPVKTYPGEEEHELTIPLAEVSMENLADLFGSSVTDLSDGRKRVTFGGKQTIVDRDLLLVAPGISGKKTAIGFYRCNVGLSGSITYGKDANARIPLRVTVLEDTSRAYGDRIGFFEEYTAS